MGTHSRVDVIDDDVAGVETSAVAYVPVSVSTALRSSGGAEIALTSTLVDTNSERRAVSLDAHLDVRLMWQALTWFCRMEVDRFDSCAARE